MLMIISIPFFTCPALWFIRMPSHRNPQQISARSPCQYFPFYKEYYHIQSCIFYSRALSQWASDAPFSQVRSSAITFLLTAENYVVRRQGVLQQHNGHT